MNAAHDPGTAEVVDRLARVDLNLLVAFDVLARECSVTRAAERMGVTQSALSHTLRRLRELLGDPLLVRGEGGMMLTPRAASLVVPVRGGLSMLGRAVAQPDPFDPRQSRRAFSLASPDVFDVLALPKLLARLRKEAPHVDLTVLPLNVRALSNQLETGEVDMAVVPRLSPQGDGIPGAKTGLLQRTLLRDRSVCLLRRGHPALREQGKKGSKGSPALTLERYAALSHLLVSPAGAGAGPVDLALMEHGLTRRVALRLPHFSSALAILAHSDLVLTAPSALAELARTHFGIAAVAAPLKLAPHHVNLTWHERFSQEPGHAWLRGLLIEVSRGLGESA